MQCEICNGMYRVEYGRTFICDYAHSCSSTARQHLCDAAIMVLTSLGLGFTALVAAPAVRNEAKNSGENPESQVTFVYVGTAVVLFFSLVTIRVIIRRFRSASSDITLQATAESV